MKTKELLEASSWKERQGALNKAQRNLTAFINDFTQDGILEMMLNDPEDLTANKELRNWMIKIKRENPEAFKFLKHAFTMSGL